MPAAADPLPAGPDGYTEAAARVKALDWFVHSARTLALVSDRRDMLLTRDNAVPLDGAPGVFCVECGLQARQATYEVCAWWPFGCQTRHDDPAPKLCWDCCDELERGDLSDAGCSTALARRRGEM